MAFPDPNPARTFVADKLDAKLQGWHHQSRETALVLADRLGVPDEATEARVSWRDRGPWTLTTVHARPVEHRWPTPHHDVLEQTLPYLVAPARIADLAAFHGGLSVHRTRGELTICCESEAANRCAVNLAHDILEARTTLHAARAAYAEKFAQRATDAADSYLRGLLFGRQVATADPDEPYAGSVRSLPILPGKPSSPPDGSGGSG